MRILAGDLMVSRLLLTPVGLSGRRDGKSIHLVGLCAVFWWSGIYCRFVPLFDLKYFYCRSVGTLAGEEPRR